MSNLLHIKQAVVVEGKYDKLRLSQITDAVIIVTNGFGVFNDKDTQALIRHYAMNTGIIILTDSDSAGMMIRGKIKGIVGADCQNVFNAYVPEILGKEKRKSKPSKEGKLGVEGIDRDLIIKALKNAGVDFSSRDDETTEKLTMTMLIEDGLSGGKNSSAKRENLLGELGMPKMLSAKAMLDVINSMMTINEYRELTEKLFGR